ncbi:MAG: zinc-dependent dehydrogenase [Anaerolineae bacterium]
MKAAILRGPKQLSIEEIPTPEAPEDGILLKVAACGLCGSDLRTYLYGPRFKVEDVIMGHEIAGTVVSVGPKVTGYAPGDRLAVAPDVHCGRCYYCLRGHFNLCDDLKFIGAHYPGGFAEHVALPGEVLERGIIHRMPEGISFIEATVAEPSSSVLNSHFNAGTTLGDTVVVIGAGPIGCLHMEVARARGARVIITEVAAERLKMAESFGPDEVIDSSREDPVARVRSLTGGVGADIVVVAVGVSALHNQAVEMARKGGRVVLFGGLPKEKAMTTLDGNLIHYGEIVVVGAFSYHPTHHKLALDLIAAGKIRAKKLVTHTFPLEDAVAAFETAARGEGLKIVLTP